MKTCTKCNIEKKFSDFYVRSRSKDKLRYECIECVKGYCKSDKVKERDRLRNKDEKRMEATRVRLSIWAKNNPEKVKAKVHNYRSRKNNTPGKLTQATIDLMYLVHGRACLKCGSFERPTIDHILPLTKGGSHYIYNLQPLCNSCNCSKSNKHNTDYRTWESV